jgi:thiol peroxidase
VETEGFFMALIHIKGKPFHTNGNLPPKGSQAPNFVLVDKDLKDCSLSDFQGKRKLLYIVPSLDTPVCLTSTKKLEEAAKSLKNVAILIISSDLPFANKRICSLEHLEAVKPLSMMRSKDFAHDYGILMKDGPLEGLTARAIVVLDEKNQVVYTELVNELGSEPNYELAFENLA